MMLNFLNGVNQLDESPSYVDLGSSYGWFVNRLMREGYDAYGVERDNCAIDTGKICYSLPDKRILRRELVSFLLDQDRKYDVVSCFSVLHHFALGRGTVSDHTFMGLLDKVTKHILFLDTGQSTEAWFHETLAGWDPQFIQRWILKHSSFDKVTPLGIDADRRWPYGRNYGRTLFACTRTGMRCD